MESTFLVVFFVLLLVSSSFSLPIVSEVEVETKSENTQTVLSFDDEMKLVPSSSTETVLEVFTQSSGGRVKRSVVNPNDQCPSDRILFYGRCMTQEEYDDYNEV